MQKKLQLKKKKDLLGDMLELVLNLSLKFIKSPKQKTKKEVQIAPHFFHLSQGFYEHC
jgi:hypothetical protein